MNRTALLLFASLLAGCGDSTPPVYDTPVSQANGLAIGGYDTVAYHTLGEATLGSPDHTTEWDGATWQFASAENLASFEADPAGMAPQYGGHCAFAYSLGKVEHGDPTLFHVVDDKVYLNSNPVAAALWSAP